MFNNYDINYKIYFKIYVIICKPHVSDKFKHIYLSIESHNQTNAYANITNCNKYM